MLGKRVLVTTFASNVARLQTLGDVARETGRQLCVAGRSLDRIIEVSQDNGYLLDFPEPVDFDSAMSLPRGEVLILATGGQGEPRATWRALPTKITRSNSSAATSCCFPSRQIPGNELSIGVAEQARGAWHHHGHRSAEHDPCFWPSGRPELEALAGCGRRHPRARAWRNASHAGAGRQGMRGIPRCGVVQQNGDMVRLAPGQARQDRGCRAGRARSRWR